MGIGLFEKLIVFFTGLAVLFVGATVALFSIMPPRSGVPTVAVDSELATMDWLDQLRDRRSGTRRAPRIVGDFGEAVEVVAETAPARNQPPPAPEQRKEIAQQAKADYWGGGGSNIPTGEQVPGIPWLRKVPGVTYAKPKKIPELLYRKYQSFEDSFALAKEGGGEFVDTDSGPAYQVNWVNENSYLHSRIGLRPGDKVISVNGQPVGKSPAAGQAMFESLKGEKQFSVLIERNKRQLVLSYTVGR
jgi:hypothetical protein